MILATVRLCQVGVAAIGRAVLRLPRLSLAGGIFHTIQQLVCLVQLIVSALGITAVNGIIDEPQCRQQISVVVGVVTDGNRGVHHAIRPFIAQRISVQLIPAEAVFFHTQNTVNGNLMISQHCVQHSRLCIHVQSIGQHQEYKLVLVCLGTVLCIGSAIAKIQALICTQQFHSGGNEPSFFR